MGNGTSQTLVITSIARINETNITNIANVNCTEKEWNYTNNIDNATITIIDDYIEKIADDKEPDYHQNVTYNLTVINVGTENYTKNVTLIDSLPEGVDFLRVIEVINMDVISFDNPC